MSRSSFSVTILSPSPSQVSLSNEGPTSATVTLNQIGDGSISNVVHTENLAWLSSNQPTLENGRYVFNVSLVESEIEPDTAYRGDIRVTYDDGGTQRSLRIPVIAQLISDEQARNAGAHFVLLVDTTPDDDGFYWAEAQVAVESATGDSYVTVDEAQAVDDSSVRPMASEEIPAEQAG